MRLTIKIVQSERGEYTAICPSLPGCVSHGLTKEEAHHRLGEAVQGYLAAVGNAPDMANDLVEA